MDTNALYNLQLRLIRDSAAPGQEGVRLEVVARPATGGPAYCGIFGAWMPVIDEICRFMESSPFHRKAIQRTLDAGLAADLINRENGKKFGFGADFLGWLQLKPLLAL